MSVSNWLEAQPGHILSVRNGLSLILSYSMSYVCCLTTTGLDVKVDPHLRWACVCVCVCFCLGRCDHINFNMRLIKE